MVWPMSRCAKCRMTAQVNPQDRVCVECWRASPAYAAQRAHWRANRWRIIVTFLPCLVAVIVLEFATFLVDGWREVRPRGRFEWFCFAVALVVFPLAAVLTWYGWFGALKP